MKPIPQSVYDRAELLSRSHPLQTVAELIGKQPSVVTRMKKRGWKAATYKRRPIPSDFQIQQAHMTFAELAVHYRCGNSTLMRWFDQFEGRRPSWRGDALRSNPLREAA